MSYLGKADNAISAMTGAATAAQSGAGSAATAAANKASKTAQSAAAKLNETAGVMTGIAAGMLPNAAQAEQDATSVRTIAGTQQASASPWLAQSSGFMNLDEASGGMSGEFSRLYKQLDPSLQMALAASDARTEQQAQTDSAVRALQRAGVSPTAAALASIRSRAAANTAALVAAVKTKARQSGVMLQMDALEKGVALAVESAGVGKSFMDAATSGFVSAAQLESTAASIKSGAASIYGSSASLVADAQNLIQAAANGQISASSLQVNAANAVVNAFTTAAEYYSTQASSMLGLAQEGALI